MPSVQETIKKSKFIPNAKSLLREDCFTQLEGIYGLQKNGTFEPLDSLPNLKEGASQLEVRRELERTIAMHCESGMTGEEAVEQFIKEYSFTYLNRFVALKMMEERRIIRQSVSRGFDSNNFRFYLADHPEDEALWRQNKVYETYKNFLVWLFEEISADEEIKILFDPASLSSRIFPQENALKELINLINAEELNTIWKEDEVIGWVYQYFSADEKEQIQYKIKNEGGKLELRELPVYTQLFTPKWIVKYLVENSLGRYWLRMHPDSSIREKMEYYIPSKQDDERIPLRKVSDIKMLDPACGTMHFGMYAFDLFYDMYLEEFEKTGHNGWLDIPSIKSKEEIPKSIIENNLYGIDIDMRSVQLAALSMYLKAKTKNNNVSLSRYNLTYTDIPPFDDKIIGKFIDDLNTEHQITKKLLQKILPLFNKAYYLGSLLKIEEVVDSFVEREKVILKKQFQPDLFDGTLQSQESLDLYIEKRIIWDEVKNEIVQTLQRFANKYEKSTGAFIAGESIKGVNLIDALINKYDVVVCNPPYSGRRAWCMDLRKELKKYYKDYDQNLYSVFIKRILDLLKENGFVGMIAGQTFMFTSSFEPIRADILNLTRILSLLQFDYGLFPDVRMDTAAFISQKVLADYDDESIFFRLVKEKTGDEKHISFVNGLANLFNENNSDYKNYYILKQEKLKAIPGHPFVYWVSDAIRNLFEKHRIIGDKYSVKEGINTGDNFRFVRYWWEIGDLKEPYRRFIKEGRTTKFYDEIPNVIKWNEKEIRELPGSAIRNKNYMGREAVTFLSVTVKYLTTKYTPPGCVFCSTGGRSIFADDKSDVFYLLGLTNSRLYAYLLSLINPTVSITVGNIANLPISENEKYKNMISDLAYKAYREKRNLYLMEETYHEFQKPPSWETGLKDKLIINRNFIAHENEISNIVNDMYGLSYNNEISKEEKLEIDSINNSKQIQNNAVDECEVEKLFMEKHNYLKLMNENNSEGDEVYHHDDEDMDANVRIGQKRLLTIDEISRVSKLTPEIITEIIIKKGLERRAERLELAIKWVSYVIGIILGRYKIDNWISMNNGVSVIDSGHQADLTANVYRVLVECLQEKSAREVVETIADKQNGEVTEQLQRFLARDFFTKWHIPTYRKRPVYWLLQSKKKKYGFYLYNLKFSTDTLYSMIQQYIDPKLALERKQLEELHTKKGSAETGRQKREYEKEINEVEDLIEDIEQFKRDIKEVIDSGFKPDIDDGVILNMAPLYKLIPSWKEPEKYYKELKKGKYEWSTVSKTLFQ